MAARIPAKRGGAGHRLGMVSARPGDDVGDAVRQAHHRVGGAAELEGSRMLETFRLHQQPEAETVVQKRDSTSGVRTA